MKILRFLVTVFISSFIVSCNNNCKQFENESYSENEMKILDLAKDNLRTLYYQLNEPDLELNTHESYRLLKGAALSEEKQVIRLDHSNENYTLTYKTFTVAANSQTDIDITIVKENTFALTTEEWKAFITQVYKSDYWTMPEKIAEPGYQGETYFVEGARPQAKECNKRTLHMTTRWNPQPGKFKVLCKHVEDLLDSKM